MSEVQDALMEADLVLPSLDAGDEHLFRYVNRPHGDISFERMVDGIAAFTMRFPGQVWLEVLLLAGVTGISSEVKKIAALAKRIGPARVQLNTVSRPPAEEFALPLSTDQMLALKGFFLGEVDIIGESDPAGARVSVFYEAREGDILALLSRRPCTSEDVAVGLGIHVTEALKRLAILIAVGKVNTVVKGGRSFYIVTGSGELSRSSKR
jgi:wyosine [tRNA(Phe)-imidazoG37] synthetase (radical SAM superfamily)